MKQLLIKKPACVQTFGFACLRLKIHETPKLKKDLIKRTLLYKCDFNVC